MKELQLTTTWLNLTKEMVSDKKWYTQNVSIYVKFRNRQSYAMLLDHRKGTYPQGGRNSFRSADKILFSWTGADYISSF